MWGRFSPFFGKQAHISRGAELAGGPHTGSPNFPPRDNRGPCLWSSGFLPPQPPARRGRQLAVRGDTRRRDGCEFLSRPSIAHRPPKPANERRFPAHLPLPPPGSGNHSPFLETNAPALLAGSPGSFSFMHFDISLPKICFTTIFSYTTDAQKHSPLGKKNDIFLSSGSPAARRIPGGTPPGAPRVQLRAARGSPRSPGGRPL